MNTDPWGWAMWPFKRKPKPNVVYPFAPMLEAMKAKDPELYALVAPMPVKDGVDRWRQDHPEDFADDQRAVQ